MSTAHPLSLQMNPFQFGEQRPERQPPPIRRRTSPRQGHALEILGHAIEYLVDSRLFEKWETPGDAAAVHLLMERSRAVFDDCADALPWHQRVQQALVKKLQASVVLNR
jgi:hypothetical protein